MLTEKSRELEEIISICAGAKSGVNVYCDRAVLLSSITSVSPVLRELAERAEQAPPGQSYLMQKKIDALRVDEASAAVNRIVDQIEANSGNRLTTAGACAF